ncbi:MAG: hypothetical protein M0Z53_11740 [Thermaerobacter sp.]|nr:hypothetical protein [Thermaerobacter sp.]
MPFSNMAQISSNRIQTGTLQFLCSLGLCVELAQTAPADLIVLAALADPQPVFELTCVKTERVLQNLCLAESLTLAFTPEGPVPLAGPFPQPVACGQFDVAVTIAANPSFLTIIGQMTGVFALQTSGVVTQVVATASPVVRYLAANGPELGQWQACVTSACFGCVAVGTAPSPAPAGHANQFSALSQITGNSLNLPPSAVLTAPRPPWQNRPGLAALWRHRATSTELRR